jgi:hypothetical protein
MLVRGGKLIEQAARSAQSGGAEINPFTVVEMIRHRRWRSSEVLAKQAQGLARFLPGRCGERGAMESDFKTSAL